MLHATSFHGDSNCDPISIKIGHPIAFRSQDYKTEVYKKLVTKALPRPGVLQLMDAAIETPGLAVGQYHPLLPSGRHLAAISLPSRCHLAAISLRFGIATSLHSYCLHAPQAFAPPRLAAGLRRLWTRSSVRSVSPNLM